VKRRKGSADAAVRTAVLYYLADRESGRAAWRTPRFAREPPLGSSLHARLDDATWAALVEEARHQEVTVGELALHAVMYFLADLDSGRLAGRLEEALEQFE
jgi:predicted DNA-binding ribbon-helix-helix protein